MKNIINLTPHEINIHDNDGEVLTVPPSGKVARIDTESLLIETLPNGVQLFKAVAGEAKLINSTGQEVDFPDLKPDTIYIVSGIFRSNFDRPDLYQPGELIRNADGQPVGCLGLSR